VWATSNPPLHTHLLSSDEDDIQHALPTLITTNPIEATLCNTLFLLWYIWKARNDNRFQRRTWTPFQVHKATAAHLQTQLSAWEEHCSSLASQLNIPSFQQMSAPSTGVLCYTDASISPDVCSPQLRQARIGIKLVDMQVQPANTICIKAIVKNVS
jgi:hypothetical protein